MCHIARRVDHRGHVAVLVVDSRHRAGRRVALRFQAAHFIIFGFAGDTGLVDLGDDIAVGVVEGLGNAAVGADQLDRAAHRVEDVGCGVAVGVAFPSAADTVLLYFNELCGQ